MTWMLPDALDRTRALPRMFATMTRWHFLARDSAEVASSDGVIGGATLWDPPGRWQSTRLEEWLMMPTFIWAFRSRAAASREVAEAMKKNHSEEPHWYLMVIGTDPSVCGAGLGTPADRCAEIRLDARFSPICVTQV